MVKSCAKRGIDLDLDSALEMGGKGKYRDLKSLTRLSSRSRAICCWVAMAHWLAHPSVRVSEWEKHRLGIGGIGSDRGFLGVVVLGARRLVLFRSG